MKICPYCKNENVDTNKFCNFCGAPLEDAQPKVEEPAVVPQESYSQPEETGQEPEEKPAESAPDHNYGHYDLPPVNYGQQVTPIPIGGYVAWSILVILFCTIPGVIALYYVLKINKATTVEEQQQTLDTAKKILIVGTALGVFSMIGQIGQIRANMY